MNVLCSALSCSAAESEAEFILKKYFFCSVLSCSSAESVAEFKLKIIKMNVFCSALSWLELSCAAVCLGTPPTGTRLPMMSRPWPISPRLSWDFVGAEK